MFKLVLEKAEEPEIKLPTSVGYNFFGQYEMSWNLICADVILTCLPVIILYVTCQRYIIGGQVDGAVKG